MSGFTQVQNDVLLDVRLSMQARLLYAVLRYHARDDAECFPGMDTLARELGVKSRRSVFDYLGELVEAGLVEKRRGGGGRHNTYRVAELRWEPGFPSEEDQMGVRVPVQMGTRVPTKKKHGKKINNSNSTRGRLELIDGGGEADALLASDVLAAFNDEAGTDFRGRRYLAMIGDRMRERPDADLDRHRRAIGRTLALSGKARWFKGSPSPDLVYANEAAFERALNLPADELAYLDHNGRRAELLEYDR